MRWLRVAAFTSVSLIIGFAMASVVAVLIGESPLKVLEVLADGAFGSPTDLGYSLYYAVPLIFTGLSVSWAFRTGLFNIGAEGQMALGGVAMTWVALEFSYLPAPVVWMLALLSAFLVGGFWSAIAGWMKAFRGAHEVLSTILLNYIAYGIVSFCVTFPMRNVESQVPETMAFSTDFKFSTLSWVGGQSPLNISLIVAVIVAIIAGVILRHTFFGFRTRIVGEAPGTAKRNAISVRGYTVLGMFIAGGFAGLAGMNDIFGYSLKVREGFTAGAGFVGIAVALLGRNSVLGILLSSLLFGALQKGALAMDIETEKVTRDLAVVIQSFIIFSVVSEKGLRSFVRWFQSRRSKHV